ncbi:glycosyltransferase family 2 protein [Candidatus Chloroploca mongolica]|nr:glycosyltransferase family 2 protein [Candidatus Chloroploca mongolica]
MMKPRVALLVLCYNGIEDTLACLESLQQLTYPCERYTIVVLDNASQDGTPERVQAAFPDVTVIENGANLGFAAGNNVGLRYALDHGYDYALLLNNDTEVAPDFLSILVAAAEASPRAGVVGPTIYYHVDPDLIWSAGGWIDWQRGIGLMDGTGQRDTGQYPGLRPVDFVTGCALLVKRRVLEQAGLLDERFFMYYEETEWSVRVARAGYGILHVPAAQVWHKIPLDARFDQEYLAYYMTRNRLLFLQAIGARPDTWLHALVLQDLRTYASLWLRPKWRTRRGRIGMGLGWLDFWRGRFGRLEHAL